MAAPIPAAPPPGAEPEPVFPRTGQLVPGGAVPRVVAGVVVATDLVCAFGFVLGFNQLATQSPIDAILPVALFSVGISGVLMLLSSLLGARCHDTDSAPTFLTPPTTDQGFAAFGLGLLALAAVGWRWGTAAQAAVVAAQGITMLLAAERGALLTFRGDRRRPSAFRLCITMPAAVLLIGFAWAALADAGIRPLA